MVSTSTGKVQSVDFREGDRVALVVTFHGLQAGTQGTVAGIDYSSDTAVVAFVDGDGRPLGIERVLVDLLRRDTREQIG